MQITKQYRAMILREYPVGKWDKNNRSTINDPTLVTSNSRQGSVLMISKLRKLLRDYGEKVSIENTLVLEILDAYAQKSRQLKAAEKEIEALKRELEKDKS